MPALSRGCSAAMPAPMVAICAAARSSATSGASRPTTLTTWACRSSRYSSSVVIDGNGTHSAVASARGGNEKPAGATPTMV